MMTSPPRQPPTILIVDDEAGLRRVLERFLERHGYRVLSAGTAEAAYDLLASEKADALLLDIHLPTMSGLALYLAIIHRWPALDAGEPATPRRDPDACLSLRRRHPRRGVPHGLQQPLCHVKIDFPIFGHPMTLSHLSLEVLSFLCHLDFVISSFPRAISFTIHPAPTNPNTPVTNVAAPNPLLITGTGSC
jgi:hypothetical protein